MNKKTFRVLVTEAFFCDKTDATLTPEGVLVDAATPVEAMELVTGPGENGIVDLASKELQPGLWLVFDRFLDCRVFVAEVK
jgi:hypothetical protein